MEHSPFSTASVMDLSTLAFLSRRTQPFGTSKVTASCISRSAQETLGAGLPPTAPRASPQLPD